MTEITLEDDLINKVVAIGHYQTPEQAVIAVLSEYIKTHSPEILLDKSYLDVDMADGEIDSLFERDKEAGSI
jgi:hypothetical protein